jgi:hypothetical protein
MARFFALSPRIFLCAAAGFFPGFSALAAPADAAPANAAPPPANSKPAVSTPNNNKPGPPTVPPQDPFNRYGNILQPGVEPAHPLRLVLPFPDVGELKVPTPDELVMREKLEQLATLSDDQIRAQLSKWPPFTKMSLKDEGMMLARIQDFRDHRAKIAQQAAHALGLLTLTPEQQARFEQEYWNKRLPMERDLAKQIGPILQQRQMELASELYREFSSPSGPLTQPIAPPKSAPAQLAATATAPAATNTSPPPAH